MTGGWMTGRRLCGRRTLAAAACCGLRGANALELPRRNAQVPRRAAHRALLSSAAAVAAPWAAGAAVAADESYKWGRDSGALLERLYDPAAQTYLPPVVQRVARLRNANIVIVGESHSNPLHHGIELRVLEAVAESRESRNVALGLECFYRQHQSALDRFVFQGGTLSDLAKETRWSSISGYPLANWAKTLNYAKKAGIRCVGLNCPIEVTRFVATQGLENMPPALRQQLGTIDVGDAVHRKAFDDRMNRLTLGDHASDMTRLYQAECVWEDYMATSAAAFYADAEAAAKKRGEPDFSTKLVIIAGTGHVDRRGLPGRIHARLNLAGPPPFTIVPIDVDWDATELPEVQLPPTLGSADLIWFTQFEV